MKSAKQARHEAKQLFRSCLKDGVLNEADLMARVKQVLEAKPRGYLQILEELQRLVKLDLDRRSAIVESAEPLPSDLREQITRQLTERHGAGLTISFAQNPALIGGLRVRVGSDVYDGSVRGRLDALQNAF